MILSPFSNVDVSTENQTLQDPTCPVSEFLPKCGRFQHSAPNGVQRDLFVSADLPTSIAQSLSECATWRERSIQGKGITNIRKTEVVKAQRKGPPAGGVLKVSFDMGVTSSSHQLGLANLLWLMHDSFLYLYSGG